MSQVAGKTRIRHARARRAELPAPAGPLGVRDFWWWSSLGLLLAAALLRVLYLTQKPLHHDEGVNGNFLAILFRTGSYHYDPSNYHGPTLYYLAVIPTAINNVLHWGHGLSTVAIRLVTAAFGVGIVWLMLCLRRFLGTPASLAAAAFATVSCGFVYFSRYFIHEILFVFFSLGVIVAWLWYRETDRPRYLMLASASAAMLYATKETWIITVAVWLIALPCTTFYLRLLGREQGEVTSTIGKDAPTDQDGKRKKLYLQAAALFVAIAVLFYTSFFTHPRGILDSVLTFATWTKTGSSGIYNREWSTYLQWMWTEEAPILVLGGIGTVVALVKASSYFTVFCAFWSMGIFAAYALVPYKTPWLALSIILPLVIMCGYAFGGAYKPGVRVFTTCVAGAAVMFCLYLAIDASFVHYDDDSSCDGTPCYPYVYAHTRRDFLNLMDEIESIAVRNPAHKDIGITVVSPEHWPMPWYLREYTKVGYHGQLVPTSEPIVIGLEPQLPQLEQQLGANYHLFSTHELRPGNKLVMFVRNDVAQ